MLPLSSNGSTSPYGDLISPYSISSALSADINAPGPISASLGEEDPEVEREQPFLLEKPPRFLGYVFMHSTPLQSIYTGRRDCQATISPPVKDCEHNPLEGEEGEEEVGSSASSARFVVAILWSSPVY